jgi:negative regulator of replication initiation
METKIIKISDETHEQLARHGTRIGHTFDDVIKRLMKFYDENKGR